MIFEEMVLHNFGVYRGRHTVDLGVKPGKPIIIVGALNGGGKTTFLDALQLVLYGKLAKCSNRGTLAYETYLRRCINRFAKPEYGAALELTLRIQTETGSERIKVHRSWRVVGKGLKEKVEIFRNNVLDPVYAEHWYEHVNEFIPSRMSNLFFFDGEKIEYFAEPENAAELLRSGLHSLLGLDIVEQLSRDLDGVVQRRTENLASDADNNKLKLLELEQRELELTLDKAVQQQAELRNEMTRLEKRIQQLQSRYREQGGELYEQREGIAEALMHARLELDKAEDHLRDIIAGDAPFLLVRELIRDTEQQAVAENAAQAQEKILAELQQRDNALLDALSSNGVEEHHLIAVKRFIESDYETRSSVLDTPRYLGVDKEIFAELSDTYLSQIQDALRKAERRREDAIERVSIQERKLNAVPQPEEIQELSTNLDISVKNKAVVEARLEDVGQRIRPLQDRLEKLRERRRRFASDQKLTHFANETTKRIVDHTGKVQQTLELFKKSLARRHLHQLELLILENLQHLLRKKRLLERVKIDPSSYAISLIDGSSKAIEPERLSAGERQLLAVSIVWALTKASGRPLPAVVDTPLGRLDGRHRERLVDIYFPNASHQVLLLSTDEEIDGSLYPRLSDTVSRAYEFRYDEERQTTEIHKGYPWTRALAHDH